jgi:uncharacterized protein (TIGR01777 family)
MSVAFTLLTIQALLGGTDNLWHHEITAKLPARRAAATELALHAIRELLYACLFLGLAWFRWQGLWAALIAAVLVCEIIITLADFVIEDRTRRLPAIERVLHTILALNYGAVLAALAPLLLGWSRMPSAVVSVSHAFSWLFSLFGIGLIAWSVRNALAVLKLRRPPEWVRDPIAAGANAAPRTILVSGATGFIGGHLVRRLIGRGERVIVLTRRADVALDRFGPLVRVVTSVEELDPATWIDAIVNLAGAPILGLPWTRGRRHILVTSRLDTTRALTTLMARLEQPVRIFVSASAIGFYGVRGDELIDESARPTQIFQSRMCQDWEAAAKAAARLGARLVRLRIGLVLGMDGGALPQLVRPVRLGLGAVLGPGTQWLSWIHIDDLVRLFEFALDTPRLSGAVNAVSPTPVTQRDFQKTMGRILHRPVWLRIPGTLIRTALGDMAELLVDGQRVMPSRAQATGFTFHHPQLASALNSLLAARTASDAPAEVYFNGACPVCQAEMSHYAALCASSQPALRFIDSVQRPNDLAACGLRGEHLERRVYLRDRDGCISSGMPALLRLWSSMPQYRRRSRVLGMPVLRQICALCYDHLVAPGLASWANRRPRAFIPLPVDTSPTSALARTPRGSPRAPRD